MAQSIVEKDRLIKHQKLEIALLLMPSAKREECIGRARAELARWRHDRLCSPDYADRWDRLLDQRVEELALAMGSDALVWGTALRQNSP